MKDGLPITFTIPGAPRTKKTHNQLTTRGERPRILPSLGFLAWNKQAQMWLAKVRAETKLDLPITSPVNCRALFFRDAFRGDAVGYYQALADALQDGRIVENDSLIVSWNGSRLLKSVKSARIEVTLEAAEDDWQPLPGTLAASFFEEEDW